MAASFNSTESAPPTWDENGIADLDIEALSTVVMQEEAPPKAPKDALPWDEDSEVTARYSQGEELADLTLTGYQKSITDDAVGAFFKEMARYPLLKANEEIELARQVRFLGELEELKESLAADLGRSPTLGEIAEALHLSEAQVRQKLHVGRAAKRRMIRSNLRLVVSIAKRYLNRGVPFLDLIQEGALGLNRATEKFDPDKGYKFSTYAYWWIRQGITRTIANDARTIRLPIHIVEKLNKPTGNYGVNSSGIPPKQNWQSPST